MRQLLRFWRIRDRKSAGQCRVCGAELEVCSHCHGEWRAGPCACGIGATCPDHGRKWTS